MLSKGKAQLRFKLLRVFSRRKCHIELKFAPQIIKRHRENLSFYHTKTKTLYWSMGVKWLAGGSWHNFLLDPVEANMTVSQIAQQVPIRSEAMIKAIG